MTEAQLWALLTFAALGGWAASLILFARATLPMANALAVTNKVDAMVDDRIAKTLERIEMRRSRGKPAQQPASKPPESMINTGRPSDEVGLIFGGPLLFEEQPDAEGIEILS